MTKQLYVVRNPKDCTTYIFDNHEAALACRLDLGLKHDNLVGQSIVHSSWPVRLKVTVHDRGMGTFLPYD